MGKMLLQRSLYKDVLSAFRLSPERKGPPCIASEGLTSLGFSGLNGMCSSTTCHASNPKAHFLPMTPKYSTLLRSGTQLRRSAYLGIHRTLALFFLLLLSVGSCNTNAQKIVLDSVQVSGLRIDHLANLFAYVPHDPPPLSARGFPIGLLGGSNSIKEKLPYPLPVFPAFHRQDSHVAANEFASALSATEPSSAAERNTVLVIDRVRSVPAEPLNWPDVDATSAPGSIHKNGAVQLTLLTFDDFVKLYYPAPSRILEDDDFCCLYARGSEECPHNRHMIIPKGVNPIAQVTLDTDAKTAAFRIPESDLYVLLLSNCGNDTKSFTGSVYLKNYYGFISGIETPRLSVHFIFLCIYGVLMVLWGMLMLRHWRNLIYFHGAAAVVLLLGALESLVWFFYYYQKNYSTELGSPWQRGIAIVSSVVKSIFFFMLVLLASLGWGITRPALETTTKRKIFLIVLAYVVFDSARQLIIQFQASGDSVLPILVCVLPVSVLHGVLFYWIFSSLGEQIKKLRQQQQHEKASFFASLWHLLLVAIIFTVIFLVAQIFYMSSVSVEKWKREWIYNDFLPHTLFIFVLCGILIFWRPSRGSRKLAYATELPQVINRDDSLQSDSTFTRSPDPLNWEDNVLNHPDPISPPAGIAARAGSVHLELAQNYQNRFAANAQNKAPVKDWALGSGEGGPSSDSESYNF